MSVDINLAIGIGVALLALAVAAATAYKYRGVPLSREEILEQRIEDLEATVRILQERIRELEEDVEHWKALAGGQPAPRRRTRPKAKRLTGDQLVDLRTALLDTFTTRSQWESLLGDIDKPLDMIATGDNLREDAGTALTSANNEGWIGRLMSAAVDARPNNASLHNLVEELKKSL